MRFAFPWGDTCVITIESPLVREIHYDPLDEGNNPVVSAILKGLRQPPIRCSQLVVILQKDVTVDMFFAEMHLFKPVMKSGRGEIAVVL